jgi:hypothetical protein
LWRKLYPANWDNFHLAWISQLIRISQFNLEFNPELKSNISISMQLHWIQLKLIVRVPSLLHGSLFLLYYSVLSQNSVNGCSSKRLNHLCTSSAMKLIVIFLFFNPCFNPLIFHTGAKWVCIFSRQNYFNRSSLNLYSVITTSTLFVALLNICLYNDVFLE